MRDLRHRLLMLAIFAAPAGADPEGDLAHALRRFAMRPEMRIDDAYKFLHQQSRGAEHSVDDAVAAQAWMREEWATLGPTRPGEELLEPLTADGRLVRVNLRPYRDVGGDPARLTDLFVDTAHHPSGTAADFRTRWYALGKRLEKRPTGNLTRRTWQDLESRMKGMDHPATHHSPQYRARYQPAYRVIDRGRPAARAHLARLARTSASR